jgi:uncharacterized protein with HEPN domain
MLDHVQMIKKTIGREIDVDYMILLEHVTYNLCEISQETRLAFPEIDWEFVAKIHDFITYEVQHFKAGDIIETVSEEILLLADILPPVREKLLEKLKAAKN